jgi:hypothetical protein
MNTQVNSSPEQVVQRQLDAYNAKNLDALMAIYADDAEQYEHPAKLLASGAAEIRVRFEARFKDPNLRAQLVKRMVCGNTVIDQETVSMTFPEGAGRMELVALYEVKNGRITKAWFIFGEKTLDPKA